MEQKRIKNPDKLYRYRPLGNSWANTLIEITGMLWFSKAEGLNDPFDGLGYALKHNDKYQMKDHILSLDRIWSVICLTTKWDNPTMWAHYANNYSGLCFGYEKKELIKHVNHVNANAHDPAYAIKGAFLEPMNYETNIPQTFKSLKEPLTIKTEHWTYEDEWRFGLLKSYGPGDKKQGARHGIMNALSEIIYTDKLKMNELLTIKKIVKESNLNIKFYKINIEKGMRVMQREEVN
ncbi:DUF2971 domain-containing protein [uncultured Psychroserpens sp.]|uniref:DUF2971 domain-containing protein n=1 Tax=uncultured Psychroserpens sp. TaxID=255436 RepID=UPI00263927C1|nr:DUF2971 domain-containing protein [uncultured Psychroserpens sp.]